VDHFPVHADGLVVGDAAAQINDGFAVNLNTSLPDELLGLASRSESGEAEKFVDSYRLCGII
jgi:hypothetical protein